MIISTGPKAISQCVEALNAGQLIGLPTETVYGLAGDATQDPAVAAIFQAKGRPQFNPLILHGHSVEMLSNVVHFNDLARQLAAHFWPGPLTLVLPRNEAANLSLLVSAGLDTVAVRIPRHPVAQDLLKAFGKPIAAPSANLSGRLSPTSAQDVDNSLGEKTAFILDGGSCTVGVESTILDLTTDKIILLRPGGISVEEIEETFGPVGSYEGSGIKSPGMLKAHYAPQQPMRLNIATPREGEAYLAFGPEDQGATLNLSPSGDLKEAAANLFHMLRQLDQPKNATITVAPIPNEGLGRAINDRLLRAALGSRI